MTGAGRGLGRALAIEVARLGYPVALQARTESELYDTRADIEALGGRARVVPGDVREAKSADDLVSRCEAELGPLQVAVACAGQAISAPILETTESDLRAMFDVNVLASFHLVKAAAKAMLARKTKGRIVVVGSTASLRGMRYTAGYAASKHAVLGMVRSAALELAPKGITVNALCPGWINTPMFEATLRNISEKTGSTEDDARKKIEATIPMGHVLETKEVAGLLRFLLSDEAAHVTGQALVMDGGSTL